MHLGVTVAAGVPPFCGSAGLAVPSLTRGTPPLRGRRGRSCGGAAARGGRGGAARRSRGGGRRCHRRRCGGGTAAGGGRGRRRRGRRACGARVGGTSPLRGRCEFNLRGRGRAGVAATLRGAGSLGQRRRRRGQLARRRGCLAATLCRRLWRRRFAAAACACGGGRICCGSRPPCGFCAELFKKACSKRLSRRSCVNKKLDVAL